MSNKKLLLSLEQFIKNESPVLVVNREDQKSAWVLPTKVEVSKYGYTLFGITVGRPSGSWHSSEYEFHFINCFNNCSIH